MTAAIMIQGTGSNVGKSLLVAGLARVFTRRGLAVRPFKPQNMSNNAAVTADGGEIGRAQALQARAAGVEPSIDMNPVLLKPETDLGAQVIVHGRRLTTVRARDYAALKPQLLGAARESFARLCAQADLVLVEGAGSPAEINLRAGDIANMGFAQALDLPVILAGDIDRGGIIAQMVGTHAVLAPADRNRIQGYLINKFRGDPGLFADGDAEIARRTGWASLGLIPWFGDACRLPAEDAADIRPDTRGGPVRMACLMLSRIANFDDLDPLQAETEVSLRMIRPGQALPGDVDLVIVPGTKSTRGDLDFIRAQGWDIDLLAHRRRGGHIWGICGGYQILGRHIADPHGIEGPPGTSPGLGLLDIETVMSPQKTLETVTARHIASGETANGYEIHIGRSTGPDQARALFDIAGRREGAQSPDGRVSGCYLHGIFNADGFRRRWLAGLGGRGTGHGFEDGVETALNKLADHLEAHVNIDNVCKIARKYS